MNIHNVYYNWTQKSVTANNCIVRWIFRVLKFLLNRIYLEYLKIKYYCKTTKECCDINGKVVVSMTTFPQRINTMWITLESLLDQKVKPRKIIVWLSKEQFHDSSCIPPKFMSYIQRGVEFRLVNDDLKSHKKYYYIFRDNIYDCPIILVDDDIIYDNILIKNLIEANSKYPKAIICNYGHKMEKDSQGQLKSYNLWKVSDETLIPVSDVFFGSGGGTLFPLCSLYKDVCRKDLFTELTPFADDIWLNCMARFAHTKVLCLGTKYFMYNFFEKKYSLISYNKSHNDDQIDNVKRYYGELFNENFVF